MVKEQKIDQKSEYHNITIRDVAQKAQVSVASVSRVLNNSGNVSDSIRQKVQSAINDLKYHPDPNARSLGKGKSIFNDIKKYVGVLFGEYVRSDHTFFSSIISGIEKTMFENRINVVISSASQHDATVLRNLPPFVEEKNLKYIISIGKVPNRLLYFLRDNGFKVVTVDDIGPSGFDCVLCDYKRGSQEAMEYLLNCGHSRIGLILGPQHHYFSKALEFSYRKMLIDRGLSIQNEYISYNVEFSVETGCEGLKHLMRLPVPPTAIFTNDEIALGVFQQAAAMHISIPESLSVVGFDDIQMAKFYQPPLTTMRIPGAEMGQLSAKLILEKMKGNDLPAQRIEISPLLIERQSCQYKKE